MKSSFGRHELLWLTAILVAALVLRFWGIRYGLPFLYVKDEYHEVMRAMQLGAGSFNWDRTGKGGLYYLLFVEYGIYFVFSKATGVVSSAREFAEQFARDPTAFYLMGRVTVALFGVATVVLVFLFARRAYGVVAALLAAAFLTVNVLHVDLSKTIRIDVVMTFFAMATLLAAWGVAERRKKRDYVLAASLAALAVTTKITAVLLIVPLLIAHILAVKAEGWGAAALLLSRKLWIGAAVFVGIWLVTNPGLIFAFTDYLDFFRSSGGGDSIGLASEIDLRVVERPNLFAYYANVVQQSMGWPLFVVAILGTGYGLWRRSAADVLIISFAFLIFVFMSSTTAVDAYYPRYVLPAMPAMAILAGRLAADATRVLPIQVRLLFTLTAGAVLVLSPLVETAKRSAILTRDDTRTVAKHWIEGNLPQDAKVFIEGAKIAPVRDTVPLRDTPESIQKRIEYWSRKEPRQAEYLRYQLGVVDGRTFELELVTIGEEQTLDAYRKMGIAYFVIIPEKVYSGRRSTNRTVGLYEELRSAPDVEMLAVFPEETSVRPGPTVEVFHLFRPVS